MDPDNQRLARRLTGLPVIEVYGRRVPVATGWWSRLLGLAFIRRSRAGPGLLIPKCRSVHTLGMLFRLDVFFLDETSRVIERSSSVGPGRLVGCRRADAVLELPVPRLRFAQSAASSPCRSRHQSVSPRRERWRRLID
ncbi:MAG: DUF192 domain-containing protein [Solirubrobacterales bacterium]